MILLLLCIVTIYSKKIEEIMWIVVDSKYALQEETSTSVILS